MADVQGYLNNYRFFGLFQSNSEDIEKNIILLSNKNPENKIQPNKNYLAFINYDYKNTIEQFPEKHNNPLNFPQQLLIEIEKTVPLHEVNLNIESDTVSTIRVQAKVTKEEYVQHVNALKQHIQKGDIYEINYCITFEAHEATINPLSLYQKLNNISHAPYAALIKLNDLFIISSSPELFLEKRNQTLYTKPIKGTAKRGLTHNEDLAIKEALRINLKERTENVMIVDVARNDLSRIAEKGTVVVDKLFDIESYQQVHQMVSTVSCQLKDNTSFNDVLKATFPMASMTGAPKIRAMELIDQYEVYNRGPYSGALGYIKENGDFNLSVLIRSIFYNQDKKYLSFTVGSAITAMCNPEDEYEECLLKAKAMMQVLGG